jgi:hypothetical protein
MSPSRSRARRSWNSMGIRSLSDCRTDFPEVRT